MNFKAISLFYSFILSVYIVKGILHGLDWMGVVIICTCIAMITVTSIVKKKSSNETEISELKKRINEVMSIVNNGLDQSIKMAENIVEISSKVEQLSIDFESVHKAAEEARKALQNVNISNALGRMK